MTNSKSRQTLAWFVANKTNKNTNQDVKNSKVLEGIEPVEGKITEICKNDEVTKSVAKIVTAKNRRGNDAAFSKLLQDSLTSDVGVAADEQAAAVEKTETRSTYSHLNEH
jgi:hypothetical protein